MPIYLGLDCGTQSLNAIAIDVDGEDRGVLLDLSLPFDETLPHYGTRNGVFQDDDPLVVASSPRMWAEALDILMGRVAEVLGPRVREVAAVSGSGQQHGSVYLTGAASARLASFDPSLPLAAQLDDMFARERSPVWMDASTSAQCDAMTGALGGRDAMVRLTGSPTVERFTGPQIRKVFETDVAGWERTEHIHLVSSYMASLLAGSHVGIDTGDGAGMNLMDVANGEWADVALDASAPGLRDRLPPVVPPDSVVGKLSSFWTKRHGFPAANVVAWTGDNPSSLVGLGVVAPGTTAISLGTSDTVFTLMSELAVDPAGTAHVFGAPTGGWMSLVCFRNGSLARERMRVGYDLDWRGFSDALQATPPGNNGRIMLPWFEPEITPPVLQAGVRRHGLDPGDAAANVRAVVEGQMLAMSLHSEWATPSVAKIHATGGAARNVDILQIMADVFDAPVHRIEVGNAACLGAALRALHATARVAGRAPSWADVVSGLAEPVADLCVQPDPEAVTVYGGLRQVYSACETRSLGGAG